MLLRGLWIRKTVVYRQSTGRMRSLSSVDWTVQAGQHQLRDTARGNGYIHIEDNSLKNVIPLLSEKVYSEI